MSANLENSTVATGLEKVSFHSNAKECSNYSTIALISHASKVTLKILHARLQLYMNFQMFKLDLEKAELEIKLPRSVGSLKMQEFQKNIYFCLTDYTKAFHWITTNWKILRDGNIRPHDLPPEKYVYRSRSNS